MFLMIFGLIVLIVCVLYVAVLLKYMHKVLFLLKKNRKKSKHKFIKNIGQFVGSFIICILVLVLIIKAVALAMSLKVDYKTNKDIATFKYIDMVDKISFKDEIINEEQVIWEHLFDEELLYEKYKQLNESVLDISNLRKRYGNEFCDSDELPFIDIDELLEHVTSLYGSDILPVTNKTLEEVMMQIPPLEERMNMDVLVFENEFYLRVVKCNVDSSDECFYQVARAADDAFKVLFNGRNPSNKKVLFYGSMAVAFYLASVKYYERNINLILVYYRVAEIYIYLYKYVDFIRENKEYRKHCLLTAEIFLVLAKEEYSKKLDANDIHEKLTYFGHYYADILFEFITKYCKGEEDEEIVSMCCKFANDYLNSPYTVNYKENREGCKDILNNLKMKK